MKGTNRLLSITFLFLFSGNYLSVSAACGVPDVLAFGTNQTISSVTPYWDPVPGAISYNLEYRIRNISATYSAPISTTTPSLTLTNLIPATDYEFIVQAVCTGELSAYSSSGWFTTAGGTTSAAVTRGPYMTVAKSSSVTIQWVTDVACNTEVKYGTIQSSLTEVANLSAVTTYHSISLNNLLPNTKYFYSVGVIGSTIQSTTENYFYTAPIDNDSVPLRFWVTGDFGNGSSSQQAVRNAFANYTSGQKINGWLWLGDNAYANGTDQEYQENVFDIYPSQFKNIPVFPALGNHDYAQSGYQSTASLGTAFPYFDIFTIPTNSGTEKYYSTNYGNVHFIALDSYGSYNTYTSTMYRWLEDDLSNNSQQWTIVYFHHAPYSKGSHNSDNSVEMVDMRNNIIPLLESNGVDLVLSGHSHAYERSQFIKGHFGVANTFSSANVVQAGGGPYSKSSRSGDGTVYAVCGVSGDVAATSSGYPHEAMFYSNATKCGSMILDISNGSLSGSFLTSTGAILDNFTITKPPIYLTSSTSEIRKDKNMDFKIFPNPTEKEFSIQFSELKNKPTTIKIFNLFGQLVYSKTVNDDSENNVIRISKNDIINCTPGIYNISCMSDNNYSTKSLIIE